MNGAVMSCRKKILWTIAAGLFVLAFLGWLSVTQPAPVVILATPATEDGPVEGQPTALGQEAVLVSEATVTVGATDFQVARLELAVDRFEALGLLLPPVEVRFDSNDGCGGGKGRFSTETSPWAIQICSPEAGFVYEHELAHAWERANLSDEIRQSFMEQNGYTVWRSHDVPWNERAVEGIALVIQQGISGLPLPPALGSDAVDRLRSFESLTGQPDPRLAEWLGLREVRCPDRPTRLSAAMPDAAGLTCD